MTQINVASLRNGTTFEMEGQPYRVLRYEHIKMGRGNATIRVKVLNLKTGATIEKTYHSGAGVEGIATNRRPLQYLYKEGEAFVFMDPETYNQFPIPQQIIKGQEAFLKEGENIDILFWQPSDTDNPEPLALDLPPKMTFSVVETPPGVKGNSATNLFKPAKLDNGMQVKVPLFVKEGEKVRIDTRTGEYVERAN